MMTKKNSNSITLETVSWASHNQALYDIRYRVFVLEQGVPEELEQDDYDPVSQHVLARTPEGQPIGTGRLLPDGYIGRVAVLPQWRQYGVGRLLMEHLLALAQQQGFRQVHLHAQVAVADFYDKLGFRSEGRPFMEADILHQSMYRMLES